MRFEMGMRQIMALECTTCGHYMNPSPLHKAMTILGPEGFIEKGMLNIRISLLFDLCPWCGTEIAPCHKEEVKTKSTTRLLRQAREKGVIV